MATDTLDRALEDAITHLGADSGTIHIKAPDRMLLVLAASRNIPAPVLDIVQEVPWGKGMAGLAAERAAPVDACNIQTANSPDVRPGARATGVQGAIVVPMLRDGQVVGTIGIGSVAEREFTPAETEWLMSHAARLAAGLERV